MWVGGLLHLLSKNKWHLLYLICRIKREETQMRNDEIVLVESFLNSLGAPYLGLIDPVERTQWSFTEKVNDKILMSALCKKQSHAFCLQIITWASQLYIHVQQEKWKTCVLLLNGYSGQHLCFSFHSCCLVTETQKVTDIIKAVLLPKPACSLTMHWQLRDTCLNVMDVKVRQDLAPDSLVSGYCKSLSVLLASVLVEDPGFSCEPTARKPGESAASQRVWS